MKAPEPPEEGPSKSLRKREAHAAQTLGEELIALKDSELVALALPERLYEAIVAARSIDSRGGGARQRQYIGKLMREIDLTQVRAALGAKAAKVALQTQRFHRVEGWRTRLIESGPRSWRRCTRLIRPWMKRNGTSEWLPPRRSGSPPQGPAKPPGSYFAHFGNCWTRAC